MNNRQITTEDLFEIIGRQMVRIEFMTRELEQLQVLAQHEQNRTNEAQLLAKRLYHQQNGADKKQAVQTPT